MLKGVNKGTLAVQGIASNARRLSINALSTSDNLHSCCYASARRSHYPSNCGTAVLSTQTHIHYHGQMDASIEILSSSLAPAENQPAETSCLNVYARIKVFQSEDRKIPFDSVTISLYGAVATALGSRAATEKVSPVA